MAKEYVISLHSPLRDVKQVDPAAPLPAVVKLPPPPTPAAPPRAPVEPPPAPSANLWETEIGQRLKEDRGIIERCLASLTKAVNDLKDRHRHQRDEMQRAVVELAITLATRLVHDQIQDGTFKVESLVRDLLAQFTGVGSVNVYLHPNDLALLEKRLEGNPLTQGNPEPRLLADPSLGRGDCRAEGGEVLMLSELEVQLNDLRRQLLRSLDHARA